MKRLLACTILLALSCNTHSLKVDPDYLPTTKKFLSLVYKNDFLDAANMAAGGRDDAFEKLRIISYLLHKYPSADTLPILLDTSLDRISVRVPIFTGTDSIIPAIITHLDLKLTFNETSTRQAKPLDMYDINLTTKYPLPQADKGPLQDTPKSGN